MKVHYAAVLTFVCVLSTPAMSPGGPSHMEFGIPTKAACEARLKEKRGAMVGYYGEKPHCNCSDDPPTSVATPKPQQDSAATR